MCKEVWVVNLCPAFHFELISVYGVRWGLTSFFCLWISNCPSIICWKDWFFFFLPLTCLGWKDCCYCFFPLTCLVSFVKNQLTIYIGLFLDSQFSPLICMFIFMSVSHSLDYYNFVLNCEFRSMSPPTFFYFFFKIVLAILGPSYFHMNFRISLSISVEKPAGILVGIALLL